MCTNTPPGRRPRAWPGWPAAGRTRRGRRWDSWWSSAGRAPATRLCRPARYRTPRRRSGGPAARRRSCTGERRATPRWCSWRTAAGWRTRWGRTRGRTRGQGLRRRKHFSQERRWGRTGRPCRRRRSVKSWSLPGEHGQAGKWGHREEKWPRVMTWTVRKTAVLNKSSWVTLNGPYFERQHKGHRYNKCFQIFKKFKALT